MLKNPLFWLFVLAAVAAGNVNVNGLADQTWAPLSGAMEELIEYVNNRQESERLPVQNDG